MNRLIAIGFEKVGCWKVHDSVLTLELSRMNSQSNILYAFINNNLVLYVGKTTVALEKRMAGYLRPSSTQRTNARNHRSLLSLLEQNQQIDIYAWADTGNHRIGEFHLNYAAGLEDSIIKMLAPPWNGAKFDDSLKKDNSGLVQSTSPGLEMQSLDSTEENLISISELDELEKTGLIKAPPRFEVELGKTYYQQGFFNVPVQFSSYFPAHGSEISMYCGSSRLLIRAYVDRKTNQKNHTPRIYGRTSLLHWIRSNKSLHSMLIVNVLNENEIEIN